MTNEGHLIVKTIAHHKHVFRCFNTYIGEFCLFDLILSVPVNNFSVMSGQGFLG